MIELAQREIARIGDPQVWFAFTKDELTPEEKAKLNMHLVSSMRTREYEWLAMNEGTINAEMFEAYAGVIPMILGTERTRR